MTEPKNAACLPGCEWGPVGVLYFHAPGCPNAEAAKVWDECAKGWHEWSYGKCLRCGRDILPAPAPEPREAPLHTCLPDCKRTPRDWGHSESGSPAPAPEPKCYHCETCRNQCSPKTGQPGCPNAEAAKVEKGLTRNQAFLRDLSKPPAPVAEYAGRELTGYEPTMLAEIAALRAEVERLRALNDGDVLDCVTCRNFVTRGRECEVCALRAEVESLKSELQAAREQLRVQADAACDRYEELAAAREEIAKLRESVYLGIQAAIEIRRAALSQPKSKPEPGR